MGTGSVALWLLRLFRVCRRCLSPFSDGECRVTVENGDRHLAATVLPAIPADICSETVPIFHYPLTV